MKIKGDNSPLTKADIASHNVIMSFLTKTNIPVLSEEGKYTLLMKNEKNGINCGL